MEWEWNQEVLLQHRICKETPSSPIVVAEFSNYNSQSTTSYSFTFDDVGVYRTTTATNLNLQLSVLGTVTVERALPLERQIRVFVGKEEAEYVFTGQSYGSGQEDGDSRKTRSTSSSIEDRFDLTNCTSAEPIGQEPFQILKFLYSPCVTPVLYRVEPSFGSRLDTVFLLVGIRFSNNSTNIEVTFGDQNCNIMISTEEEIMCMLTDTSSNTSSSLPKAFVPLPVSLWIAEEGKGRAYIANASLAQVQLHPVIVSISPLAGSILGGTNVTITGDTFSFDASTTEGLNLRFPCVIIEMTYRTIRCRTEPVQSEQAFNVSFGMAGRHLDTLCHNTASNGCTYTFSEAHTPQVTAVSPAVMGGADPTTTIVLTGSGLSAIAEENVVMVGGARCSSITAASTGDNITCSLAAMPASSYTLTLEVKNLGRAYIPDDISVITSEGRLTSVIPIYGSIFGGTELTITGSGFHEGRQNTLVLIGPVSCVVRSVNLTSLVCVTEPTQLEAGHTIQVTGNGVAFVSSIGFEFLSEKTPTVTGVDPTSGQSGDTVRVIGSRFGSAPNSDVVVVRIGEAPCSLDPSLSNDSLLTCVAGENFVGVYGIDVTVHPLGNAQVSGDITFRYGLTVTDFVPTRGSYAGRNTLRVFGTGFDPSSTEIAICGQLCHPTNTLPTLREIECTVPQAPSLPSGRADTLECKVMLNSNGVTTQAPFTYTYSGDMTPEVTGINRTRGGTQGGSAILIWGEGFSGSVVNVSISRSECVVTRQDNTTVECVTGASSRTVRDVVLVFVQDKGYALSSVEFWYVDLWSSNFTWGGGPLPREGDFVVIEVGQTVVLDTFTPILSYLLIRGELIFDREAIDDHVELHTQGVLITSGGRLEIGTEDDPFLSKTTVVLYGHILSTEIPIYGAKSLGLRSGVIDIHGRPLNKTWTWLSQTALAGDTTLHLKDYVDWEVGGEVVVSSTSFSQRENEVSKIVVMTQGESGSILTLEAPLVYEHISVRQVIDGRVIDTCAEVGYLTRNVVVRGNKEDEWIEEVEGCDEEFRPGQFQVQTCFRGRFGSETATSQFGGQIFMHAEKPSQGLITGRFSYMEVTHAGQAFRLGRYPIHFHLSGNVSGSYVKGCGLHRTFNRAVTVHGVDHLLVERNVAYDVLGHAYFLEDGNEQFNVIQGNLGVFVRGSSSLLNVDITPATFWIVNPNNIVRDNAAAGGTHFGFWYRIPKNPTSPSFDSTFCPYKQRVLEFYNNTAHSFGWYGLWVFRNYYPTPTGNCWDNDHAPSYFNKFLSWHNDRGVEFVEAGSLQLNDSVLLDNKLAGLDVVELESVWGKGRGPAFTNSLVVGYSGISPDDFCTKVGLKTPKSNYLTVSSVTFANFNRNGCLPIQACSQCKTMQGGFETHYEGISFINAGDQLTRWQWEHEHVHRDLDGTLTGTGVHSVLVPTSGILDPGVCQDHPQSASNGTRGSICDGGVHFGRVALFNPTPSSLEFTAINFTNEHGTTFLPYVFKRLRGGPGHMALLQLNTMEGYWLTWLEGQTLTNISYSVIASSFQAGDYLIVSQKYPQVLDGALIAGEAAALEDGSVFDDPASQQTGVYSIGEDNTTLSYVIRATGTMADDTAFTYSTYRCLFVDCILPTPPPPVPLGRPNETLMWSDPAIWPGNRLPQEGEDVSINGSVYVILDTPTLPRLRRLLITDGASLELLDGIDHTIEADLIVIHGGRLVAGYPDLPFQSKARFVLHGTSSTPEYRLDPFSPIVGAKAVGVFGELILNAPPRERTWTLLSCTADIGADAIQLVDSVDWEVGHLVVITSTSYDAYQSEVLEISSTSIDRHTLHLNGTLRHAHRGADVSDSLHVRAEVGLLSRSIVIESAESAYSQVEEEEEEPLGCRVLVSSSATSVGVALLSGVEFRGCGQLGYTEHSDPRFALAFLNTGELGGASSYVRECSFHGGFNTALGAFGTDALGVHRNVIHDTVGPSMVLTGYFHNVTHNLASLSRFIGTYAGRDEPLNDLWTANYELVDIEGVVFSFNHAAGGAKACFHLQGEECPADGPLESTTVMRSNVGHSALHGIHLGYRDGRSTCSLFYNYTIFSCFHYGIFSYSSSGIFISHSKFLGNKAGVYVSVIGPPSLSHVLGTKTVRIEHTIIASSANSEHRCEEDSIVPAIASHGRSYSGILSQSGGHVGVVIPSFVSGSGHFPIAPWHSVSSYPAIDGLTTLTSVTFLNFETSSCSGNSDIVNSDIVMTTNPSSEDANHPVELSDITFRKDNGTGTLEDHKVFVPEPNLNSVNPSDCVDMDCDGRKAVLIRDLDGSFTESGLFHTIVSRAEFGWDGNNTEERRRGVGDFRIPRTMLTEPDGSRVDASELYPEKGIVRSTPGNSSSSGSSCTFNSRWNMYLCTAIDHLMLVMESLDKDTELRRLSPIGLGANGYINLINGPMDHGWCGGYTCQERISTFYAVVASGLNYTVGLTSTNPQEFALHLLNSDDTQGIVVALIHNTPQRLDVYVDDGAGGGESYVVPKNAFFAASDQNLEYMPLDPDGPADQFVPTLDDPHGTNFYDTRTKKLYIVVKGNRAYRVSLTPVVVLSLNLTVTVEQFFDEANLKNNLALLLGIPQSKIRVVNVVRETNRRRRRRRSVQDVELTFQIGDSPMQSDGSDMSGMNGSEPQESGRPGNETELTFDALLSIYSDIARIIELGGIPSITSVFLVRPDDPVVDPTNGTRATPDTGGPQPEDNVTLPTYYELQLELEERLAALNLSSGGVALSLPALLVVIEQGIGLRAVVEGLPFSSPLAPSVAMHNVDGSLSATLGAIIPWVLTAAIYEGPEGAFLTQTSAIFSRGRATFQSLVFSHPGVYTLAYDVTSPPGADFHIVSLTTVAVEARDLGLKVVQQPRDGNITFELYPYPSVELVDLSADHAPRVRDHSWRNNTWYVEARIGEDTYPAQLVEGVAMFANVRVFSAGRFNLTFHLYQETSRGEREYFDLVSTVSVSITVEVVPLTRFFFTYGNNLESTDTAAFSAAFKTWFLAQFLTIETLEAVNVTATPTNTGGGGVRKRNVADEGGTVVVAIFVTALDIEDLIEVVSIVSARPVSEYSPFVFDDVVAILLDVTQDPALPVESPGGGALGLSLATVIPCILFFLSGVACTLAGYASYRKYHKYKVSAAVIVVSDVCAYARTPDIILYPEGVLVVFISRVVR